MANVLFTIFNVVSYAIYIYSLLIVIYTLLTWVPSLLDTSVGRLLSRIVNPYLELFDRFIPSFAGISFSPVIALLVLYFFNNQILPGAFNMILRLMTR